MAKVYEVTMGGSVEQVETLKEVAAILGVTRVAGKDIEAGKYPEVSIVEDNTDIEDAQDAKEFLEEHIEIVHVTDAPTPEPTEDTVEDMDAEVEQATKETEEAGVSYEDEVDDEVEEVEDSIEYPEVGEFKDEKAIKKYIKKLSDEELQEWCELEGATWKPNDHASINRMRMAMAIKAVHFPELAKPKKTKKKSKYADYSTEDLVQMALDNDVVVPDAKGDERIERMYTIMALRKAGLIS